MFILFFNILLLGPEEIVFLHRDIGHYLSDHERICVQDQLVNLPWDVTNIVDPTSSCLVHTLNLLLSLMQVDISQVVMLVNVL